MIHAQQKWTKRQRRAGRERRKRIGVVRKHQIAACSSCIQIAKLDTMEAIPAPAAIGAKHKRST